jgi:hypothetical protein
LANSPKFCLKFFFQQKSQFFWRFLPKFYWNIKGGPEETFLNLVQKISSGPHFEVLLYSSQNILWYPPLKFSRLKSKHPLVPPLRFSLKFLKNRGGGGGKFSPWFPLWDFFQRKFSRGGYTLPAPPLAKLWL